MPHEVELKLTLPEAELRRFSRHPLLRKPVRRHSEHLVNVYYDTPDLALHCNGVALRVRRSGRRWLQTVKCAGLQTSGLSDRPEWEGPYSGTFDFGAVDERNTHKLLERVRQRLVPVFETDFRRTTWQISRGSGHLLVALDRGEIVVSERRIPIREVEIELAGATIDDLFDLADQLAQRTPLVPEPLSKAERGYHLYSAKPEMPFKAVPLELDQDLPAREAFRRIAFSCLDHLQRNQRGAVNSDDPEYIHQMRVALRRLRAALRTFGPVLPASLGEQLLPPMRALAGVLGAARDLDVVATEIVAPVIKMLPQEPRMSMLATLLAMHRSQARERAVEALCAPEYGRLLLLATALLTRLPRADRAHGEKLVQLATARLKQMRRKLKRLARAARKDDPASLHAVRIGAKRLRYALEFFIPLLPARRTNALIKQLARLQNHLGQLNDLANAGALLMDCAADDPGLREAVSLVGGWHGKRHTELLGAIPRALEALHAIRLPQAEK